MRLHGVNLYRYAFFISLLSRRLSLQYECRGSWLVNDLNWKCISEATFPVEPFLTEGENPGKYGLLRENPMTNI